MARPRKGQVVERKTSAGIVYALRFTAYGERQYVTLGSRADGWTRQKAETELQDVLADVRRGTWRPPAPGPQRPDPTFHEFASEWLAARKPAIAPSTYQSYRNELVHHLLRSSPVTACRRSRSPRSTATASSSCARAAWRRRTSTPPS